MTKLAKNIKVGDTVNTWAFPIKVESIRSDVQKNGKLKVVVTGNRIFKSESEKKSIIKTWGKSALIATESFKENTKVKFS